MGFQRTDRNVANNRSSYVMSPQTPGDIASAAVQTIPSVVVVTKYALGMPIQDWLAVSGIAFILLQAAYLVWKWRREAKGRS